MRGAESVAGQHSFRISGARHRGLPAPRDDAASISSRRTTVAPLRRREARLRDRRRNPTWRLDAPDRPSGVGKTLARTALHRRRARDRANAASTSPFRRPRSRFGRRPPRPVGIGAAIGSEQLVIHHIPPVELDLDEVGAARPPRAPRWRRQARRRRQPRRAHIRRTRDGAATCLRLGSRRVRPRRRRHHHLHERDGGARPRRRPGRALVHLQQRLLPALRRDSSPSSAVASTSSRCGKASTKKASSNSRSMRTASPSATQLQGVSGLLGWSALRGDDEIS